jgi:23S rRNA (cytidine1920-2'-O)/16S rRNA (cytidine1409-2'-O)-methyltransferase
LAGKVKVDGEVVDKPGRRCAEDCRAEVAEPESPFAGRGGIKLAHALTAFDVRPAGKTALDVGASTGGFTDCLLQAGAVRVFAVDVGYGQLDWKLRTDSRVTILERTNARTLTLADIDVAVDLAVIDVSFISLTLVIPPVLKLLKPDGEIVALVKPQFEVGKKEVENKGIIKNPEKHLSVLRKLTDFVRGVGWVVRAVTASPITGQKGNREFFIHCVAEERGKSVDEAMLRALALGET